MQLNPFDILVLISLLQGLLLGLVIGFGKLFRPYENKFLAASIIILCIIGIHEFVSSQGFSDKSYWVDFFGNHFPWTLLYYAPMIVYFLYAIEHPLKDSKWLILLAFPFFIFLVINMIDDADRDFGWIQTGVSNATWRLIYSVEYLLGIIYNVGLCIWAYFIIHRSTVSSENKKWLTRIWLFNALLFIIWIIISFLPDSIYDNSGKIDYYLWIGIGFFIYWLTYKGVFQFNLSKDRNAIQNLLQEKSLDVQTETKDSKNTLSSENAHLHALKKLMEEQHLYKDENLNLESVASKLGISASYLSQIVSANMDQKFTRFVNTYRVNEVKKMILDPEFDKYSLLAIGREAGFKSKSAFYNTFKKMTNYTPNQFKTTYRES